MAKVDGEFTLECCEEVNRLVAESWRKARIDFGKRFARLGGRQFDVRTVSGIVNELVVISVPSRQASDLEKELRRLQEDGKIRSCSEGVPSGHEVPLLNFGKTKGSTKTKAATDTKLMTVWLLTENGDVSQEALDTLKRRISHIVSGQTGMRILREQGTQFVIAASGKIPSNLKMYGQLVA